MVSIIQNILTIISKCFIYIASVLLHNSLQKEYYNFNVLNEEVEGQKIIQFVQSHC